MYKVSTTHRGAGEDAKSRAYHDHGDGCSERRLAVVNVTDGPDVQMGL